PLLLSVSYLPKRYCDASRVDLRHITRRGVHSNRRGRWARGPLAGGRQRILLQPEDAPWCSLTLCLSQHGLLLACSGLRKAVATILIGIVPVPANTSNLPCGAQPERPVASKGPG